MKKLIVTFSALALSAAQGHMRCLQGELPSALAGNATPVEAGQASGKVTDAPQPGLPHGEPELKISVNKSLVLEHAAGIRRISISNPEIAEAVAVSSTEVLINGKAVGETTLLLWDSKGARSAYNVQITASTAKLEAVRKELLGEVGSTASVSVEEGTVFLRGTVADQIAADRAASLAATLGKVVNLLRVVVGPGAPQILLKVRFANVSRSASSQLGFNFFSGNQKGIGNSTTSQFGQPPTGLLGGNNGQGATLTDLLNIFYFRPDLNIGAVIQALEAKSLAQTLAEPNLLTVSGRQASFLAGGEFPFPTIQGGAAGIGQITVEFKEFGIRLSFLPTVTPRGTIHLEVTPEVSSLDYTNGLTVNGFTVPGLATRRVQTEVELNNGQSFVIAGLLDNEVTQQLDKVPGIGNIPILGKLFQSRSISKSDSELLVLVTPELVGPIPGTMKPPEVDMPLPFLRSGTAKPPQTPGPEVTGSLPKLPQTPTVPIEYLKSSGPNANAPNTNAPAPVMLVRPVTLAPDTQQNQPNSPTNPAPTPTGSGH